MAAINRMSMAQQLNEQVDGQSILDGILEEVATASSAFTGVGADVAKASLAQSKEDTAKSRAEGLVARKGSSDIVKAAFTDPNASDVRDLFAVMKANEKNNEAEINADREARIIKASAEAPVDTNNSDNYNIGKAAIDARKNRVVSEQDQTFLDTGVLIPDDVPITYSGDQEAGATGRTAAIEAAVREAVGEEGETTRKFPARPTGLMTRTGLSDDDMGLPTYERSSFMAPNSLFRKALKEKESGSYSSIFGDSEKVNTSNVNLTGLAVNSFKGTDITTMPMSEIMEFVKNKGDFHKYNLARTNPKDGKPKPVNTTAIGKYQFVGATLRDLKKRGVFKKLGITDDTLFDESTQDALSEWLVTHRLKDRGDGTMAGARKEMRNEWEGFKKISDSRLDSIINEISSEIGVSIGGTKLSPRESLRPKSRPSL